MGYVPVCMWMNDKHLNCFCSLNSIHTKEQKTIKKTHTTKQLGNEICLCGNKIHEGCCAAVWRKPRAEEVLCLQLNRKHSETRHTFKTLVSRQKETHISKNPPKYGFIFTENVNKQGLINETLCVFVKGGG